jgi:hypothetical protein
VPPVRHSTNILNVLKLPFEFQHQKHPLHGRRARSEAQSAQIGGSSDDSVSPAQLDGIAVIGVGKWAGECLQKGASEPVIRPPMRLRRGPDVTGKTTRL